MLIFTYRRMRFTAQPISHLLMNMVNARAMYYSVPYTSVTRDYNYNVLNSAKSIVN